MFTPLLERPIGGIQDLFVFPLLFVCEWEVHWFLWRSLSVLIYLSRGSLKGIQVPPGICSSAATRAFAKSTIPHANAKPKFSQQLYNIKPLEPPLETTRAPVLRKKWNSVKRDVIKSTFHQAYKIGDFDLQFPTMTPFCQLQHKRQNNYPPDFWIVLVKDNQNHNTDNNENISILVVNTYKWQIRWTVDMISEGNTLDKAITETIYGKRLTWILNLGTAQINIIKLPYIVNSTIVKSIMFHFSCIRDFFNFMVIFRL